MEFKFCNKCKKEKSINDFHKNPTKKDGLQSMCKECRIKYHREHYLKNKYKYIDNAKKHKMNIFALINRYKQMKKCKICGDNRFWVLEFHHKNGKDKINEIARLIPKNGLYKIKEEIKKCEVLCSNCHKDLHYNMKCK